MRTRRRIVEVIQLTEGEFIVALITAMAMGAFALWAVQQAI